MKDVKTGISQMTSDQLKQIKLQTDKDENYSFDVSGCNILGTEVVIKRK